MNAASVRISQHEQRVTYPKSRGEIAYLLRWFLRRDRLAVILCRTWKF